MTRRTRIVRRPQRPKLRFPVTERSLFVYLRTIEPGAWDVSDVQQS